LSKTRKKKAAGKTQPAAVVARNGVRLAFAVRSPEKLSRCYFFAGAAARTFSHTVVVVAILPSIADRAGSLTIVSLRPSILMSRTEARSVTSL
jgi:hypothetical protein